MTAQAENPRGGRAGQGARIGVWGGAAALILAAAAAALLSEEVRWTAGDFILAGTILLGGCALFELLMRRGEGWAYRGGAMVAAAAGVMLFLAAGAVGLAGGEDEPANLVFLAVIAVAAAGSAVARFRPRGMARAMGGAAAAQVLAGIAGLALVADVQGFLLGTALFASLWLLSAWLFRKAA